MDKRKGRKEATEGGNFPVLGPLILNFQESIFFPGNTKKYINQYFEMLICKNWRNYYVQECKADCHP